MNINLARYIDHTNLKADALPSDIETLCKDALRFGFASVCINPLYVPLASSILANSTTRTCTVVGFPLGACSSLSKADETANAIDDGANEIDMVLPVGILKSGDANRVLDDISGVVDAADGNLVKVIIEACLLTDDEKVLACQLAKDAGADFVKTSTGFSKGGAIISDVKLMRATVGDSMGVKAAGGIRDLASAMEMIHAGASRIGTSNGIKIIQEYLSK